jgi:hypothetical protein
MKRIVLALLIVAASCTSPPPPQRDPLGTALAAATTKAFETHSAVTIAAVTTFAWDRFYAFKPKLSPDQINGTLGFTWAKDYSDQTDTYCLLVFIQGKAVVHSLLFPRYRGDCTTIDPGPYDKAHAVFTLTSTGKTTGGQPFLQLKKTS